MKYRFEKYSRNNKWLSVVMVLLGLALFIWPGKSLELVARILGIGLLAGAVISCISWFKEKDKPDAGYATLAVAIVCAVAGVIVLVAPKGMLSLLPKLIGAAIAINGILNLAQALELRNKGGVKWMSALAMAVLTILLGLFLIFFAFGAMKAAVMVIGGIFIYNGASNLWIESRYKKGRR